jgi:transposase
VVARIIARDLLVFFLDECHLVWGDALGYVWGPMGERVEIPIESVRKRQSYYGALNVLNGRTSLFPADKGKGANTVAFLKWLRWRHQCRPMICVWDRASYHWCEEVRTYLRTINGDRSEAERAIHLIPFARYAPEQNPIEDVWLAGKREVRRQWFRLDTFADVKACFSTTIVFHSSTNHEKLNWYGRSQLI